MSDWDVTWLSGTAAELHATPLPTDSRRRLWVLEATRPAVVIGSTQGEESVDAAEAGVAGVDVVRRRSGGGAVLLSPGRVAWFDVVLPAGDALWDDDVGRSSWWLGQAFADALSAVGVRGAAVHRGRLERSAWGRIACFASCGPGEVTVAGHKAVGISQRRTRAGARFQVLVHLDVEPEAVVRFLALPPADAAALADVLAARATAVHVTQRGLLAALRAALPA